MSDKDIEKLAENARSIVSGYAFSPLQDGFISILNLKHPDSAMIVTSDGEIVETNMDQIEQKIVTDLCKKNLQFMEEQGA